MILQKQLCVTCVTGNMTRERERKEAKRAKGILLRGGVCKVYVGVGYLWVWLKIGRRVYTHASIWTLGPLWVLVLKD